MSVEREIVVELEHVRLVRRSARTTLRYCEKCSQESDFVSAADAARIFDLGEEKLRRFIETNGWHLVSSDGCVLICTASVLKDLAGREDGGRPRLLT
jgi:hypothetical protein